MKETIVKNMKTGMTIAQDSNASIHIVDNRTLEEKKAAVIAREKEREVLKGTKGLTFKPFAGFRIDKNGRVVKA